MKSSVAKHCSKIQIINTCCLNDFFWREDKISRFLDLMFKKDLGTIMNVWQHVCTANVQHLRLNIDIEWST